MSYTKVYRDKKRLPRMQPLIQQLIRRRGRRTRVITHQVQMTKEEANWKQTVLQDQKEDANKVRYHGKS